MSSKGKIAKNSLILYIRMGIVMGINLYAIRFLIEGLGLERYGVYNVIAGVVSMFSFVTTILATSTQRYYSYYLGNNTNLLKEVFSVSLKINKKISFIVFVLCESLGVWFINTKLVIPSEQLFAANIVFQTSIISFVSHFLQVPYSAAVIAHEEMNLFAYISISECVLKFLSAFFLLSLPQNGRLSIYGIFIALISLTSLFVYILICKKKYTECHYVKNHSRTLGKEIMSFSGWTLFSSLAGILMYQVNTILVNIFFGPIVNAARGISLQINSALSSFVASFFTAVRPPMIKTYAQGEIKELLDLFDISNKFILYSILMISVPLIIYMPDIIQLWLNKSDSNIIIFCRFIVIYNLILSLNNPISTIIQASGEIKYYSIVVESFTISCMPITYIFYKLGYPAYSTYLIMIVMISSAHLARLYFLKRLINQFDVKKYLFVFLGKGVLLTFILVGLFPFFAHLFNFQILNLISYTLTCVLATSIYLFLLVLNTKEKQMIITKITSIAKSKL